MDELKVAIPEKGEVLLEWGDRREVISLSVEAARKLDLALPNKAPGESGILSTLYMDVSQYSVSTCRMILKSAFACCKIPVTDSDFDAMEEEMGFGDVALAAVSVLRPVVMGKKKYIAFLDRVKELSKAANSVLSLGTDGSASPSASSTSAP